MSDDKSKLDAGSELSRSSGYTEIEHVCCICDHRFHSATAKDARHTVNAAKVNRDGPYCELCRNLEMAARYAEARGYAGIREAMNQWKRYNTESSDAGLAGKPENRRGPGIR